MPELIQNILARYECPQPVPSHPVRCVKPIHIKQYDGMTSDHLFDQLVAACEGLCEEGFTQEENGINRGEYMEYTVLVYYLIQSPLIEHARRKRAVNRRLLPWARRQRL